MVLDYYNLPEQPFGVTPDPRYLYLGPTHREALASLAYGIQNSRGFLSLVASPGMGKTTILFHLVQQLESSARIAFLCQTLCQPQDIMRGVLRDLGVADDSSDMVQLGARLNDVLHAEARLGRKVIVVIDEAQNLNESALELVRLLSNFETTREKLMQIVLAGQPQLGEKLASPQLLQLRQRMSVIARLQPFDAEETQRYIAHRLRAAGCGPDNTLFTSEAGTLIARYSCGIPRNINNICFNAVSLGYVLKQKPIGKDVINEVATDLDLEVEAAARSSSATARRSISVRLEQKRNLAFGPTLAWQKIVAICALLFLLLGLAFSGKWRVKTVASGADRPAATIATEQPISQTAKAELVPANEGGTGSSFASSPTVPGPGLVAATQVKKSRADTQDHSAASDPDKLWERVKKQDSNAEITLARMYLEGTNVPQNCPQAQVLLLAASRKGNARAADMLNNYANQCH